MTRTHAMTRLESRTSGGTRFETRMRDAREGNEREVLEKYNREIAAEQERKRHSHNAFVRECCDQQIERLRREKEQIEAATVD